MNENTLISQLRVHMFKHLVFIVLGGKMVTGCDEIEGMSKMSRFTIVIFNKTYSTFKIRR